MLKIIRFALYGLAITTGMVGLIASGVPLAKYALQQWRNREEDYYYDTSYLHAPEIIFLLSLILLICVHIGLMVGKGAHKGSPASPVSPRKQAEDASAPANEITRPANAAGTTATVEPETADEKLKQLLNQKKK